VGFIPALKGRAIIAIPFQGIFADEVKFKKRRMTTSKIPAFAESKPFIGKASRAKMSLGPYFEPSVTQPMGDLDA
jgi:hypothetical protein